MLCPKCVSEGWNHRELDIVFAIPKEHIQAINPVMPDIDQIKNMLNEGKMADVGFCPYGHGLLNIKQEVEIARVKL